MTPSSNEYLLWALEYSREETWPLHSEFTVHHQTLLCDEFFGEEGQLPMGVHLRVPKTRVKRGGSLPGGSGACRDPSWA